MDGYPVHRYRLHRRRSFPLSLLPIVSRSVADLDNHYLSLYLLLSMISLL